MSSASATETPGQCLAPEELPPAADESEPGGADGNERLVDARVSGQPVPNGSTGVAGEIVGEETEVTVRVGAVQGLEQRQVATGVAGRSGLGQGVAITDAQRAVDPDPIEAALVSLLVAHRRVRRQRRPSRRKMRRTWLRAT